MRRAVSSAAFVGKTPGGGRSPKRRDLGGVYLPTKPHHQSLFTVPLVFVSRPLAPLSWRLTGLPLSLFMQGGSQRGDELALRSLGIFDDPVPLLVLSESSFGEVDR